MDDHIISHFLPSALLDFFIIKEVADKVEDKTGQPFIEIHLEERNNLPLGFDSTQYESKGFSSITLQDFPIRGKAVYLVLKRRLWRHKGNAKDVIKNTLPFVADGSRLTKELSDFLKDTS